MTIYISLLVAIVSLLIYAFTTNAKVSQAALFAWGAGLTAFLITAYGEKLFRL